MSLRTSDRDTGELHAGRYVALFSVLIAIFLAMPFLGPGRSGGLLLEILLLSVLLSSLRAIWQNRWIVLAAVVPGLGLFASPNWGLIEASNASLVVSSLGLVGFLAVIIVALCLDVYRARSVTFSTILGACSIYLLIGVFWFGVFGSIEAAQPNSFVFAETHPADVEAQVDPEASAEVAVSFLERRQLFYYTFVTLSTLGYGDVRPVSELARVYATLAAVMGQLFLAILVARLVGMHASRGAGAIGPSSSA